MLLVLVLVLETRNEGLSHRFLNSQAISIKKIKGPWNPLTTVLFLSALAENHVLPRIAGSSIGLDSLLEGSVNR